MGCTSAKIKKSKPQSPQIGCCVSTQVSKSNIVSGEFNNMHQRNKQLQSRSSIECNNKQLCSQKEIDESPNYMVVNCKKKKQQNLQDLRKFQISIKEVDQEYQDNQEEEYQANKKSTTNTNQ